MNSPKFYKAHRNALRDPLANTYFPKDIPVKIFEMNSWLEANIAAGILLECPDPDAAKIEALKTKSTPKTKAKTTVSEGGV